MNEMLFKTTHTVKITWAKCNQIIAFFTGQKIDWKKQQQGNVRHVPVIE